MFPSFIQNIKAMGPCLSLTTLLVLMLQALNGVRLQKPTSTEISTTWPPFWRKLEKSIDTGNGTLGIDTNMTRQDNATNDKTASQADSTLNSTSSVGEGNTTGGLPASPSPRNDTAGNPVTTSLDVTILPTVSLQPATSPTKPKDTGLPAEANSTISTGDSPESHANASSTAEQSPVPAPSYFLLHHHHHSHQLQTFHDQINRPYHQSHGWRFRELLRWQRVRGHRN